MNVITINGVEYTRASILGKEFKYTADYIGQLCRGHKVDAQLVGRTWYVNPLSLKSHKKSRYTKSGEVDKTIEYNVEINKSRIDVVPTLNKNTLKKTRANDNFVKRIDWKPVKYEFDESDLLPDLKNAKKKLNIDLAESTTVSVDSVNVNTTMVPEPLPTVSLSGTLKIASLNESYLIESDADPVISTVETDPVVKKEEENLNFLKRARVSKQKLSDIETKSSPVVLSSDLLTPKLVKEAISVEETTVAFKWFSTSLFFAIFLYITFLLFVNFNISATSTVFENNFYFSTDVFNLIFFFLGK